MKKILLLAMAASIVLTSCENFGKELNVNDKNTVYYKGDGVTEADAKKLGDYLVQNGTFDGKEEKDAQLSKEGDVFIVRLPVKEDVISKDRERYETIFWYWQDLISEGAFEGKKTRIILTDNKFKDQFSLEEMNKIAIGKENHVYFKGKGIDEKNAKNIGDSLAVAKFFDYTAGDLLLTKEKGEYAIRFLPNEQMQNQSQNDYAIILENYKYIISKYVLNGDEVTLYIIDADFNDVKKIKDPSDERKAQIEQMLNG